MEIVNLTSILSVFILFLIMIITIIVYFKIRIFLIILVIYSFSLIIGMSALSETSIPFSPYLQIFFLLFESVIFLMTSIEVYSDIKEKI